MHYFVIVFVPDDKNSEDRVNTMMAPYDENNNLAGERHWDWYVIGGRWDGLLTNTNESRRDQNGFNFGDEHHRVEHNCCPVEKLEDNHIPYAFISSDGKWHARSHWDGKDWNEKGDQEWEAEFWQAVDAHKGQIAVGVDCHS